MRPMTDYILKMTMWDNCFKEGAYMLITSRENSNYQEEEFFSVWNLSFYLEGEPEQTLRSL